ncbi:hypothetical protein GGR56DRAFT_551811 [Xylariaceae sp. FL0804]|nr:hypothetical protein GGR56DRAFT_551811 [Xylariaceae sp. FL0804]
MSVGWMATSMSANAALGACLLRHAHVVMCTGGFIEASLLSKQAAPGSSQVRPASLRKACREGGFTAMTCRAICIGHRAQDMAHGIAFPPRGSRFYGGRRRRGILPPRLLAFDEGT